MFASRLLLSLPLVVLSTLVLPPALAAQPSESATGQHEQHQQPQTPAAPHVHAPPGMEMFPAREGSGTSWLPATTPMYGIYREAGPWQVMWHGSAFAQFLHDGGDRGHEQAGSINWAMGMARRELRGGRLGVRGMVSLEPLTIPGCGYPDLLATGEVCDGKAIYDRQHPHDLFMELAVEYDRATSGDLRWQLYGGLAGEPALGPVAYPHRISAMPNPLAPIGHHWLDATHITFGVITGGVYNGRWKAEASLFNGREPDQGRWDLDLAPLDSISGRVSFAPRSDLVLQISAGHLDEAEPGDAGEPHVDVERVTASATYHREVRPGGLLAATVAWGRNAEADDTSHAFLAESSLALDERHTWFGRLEVAGKPAHDLDIHDSAQIFTVAKIQAGFTRHFDRWSGLLPGVGGTLSASIVPASLEPVYGGRVSLGVGLFVTLRPGGHGM